MQYNHNWVDLAHILEYSRIREHEEFELENEKLKVLMSIIAGRKI